MSLAYCTDTRFLCQSHTKRSYNNYALLEIRIDSHLYYHINLDLPKLGGLIGALKRIRVCY